MELQQGLFAVKLRELEQEYGRLQSRIHIFQEKNVEQVQRELERLQDEYRERALLLDECVRSSRSTAMSALAQAQLDYNRRVEQILKAALGEAMPGGTGGDAIDQAESVTLFAEYAIDFATQAMRQALTAALTAIVLQQRAEQTSLDMELKTGSDRI